MMLVSSMYPVEACYTHDAGVFHVPAEAFYTDVAGILCACTQWKNVQMMLVSSMDPVEACSELLWKGGGFRSPCSMFFSQYVGSFITMAKTLGLIGYKNG